MYVSFDAHEDALIYISSYIYFCYFTGVKIDADAQGTVVYDIIY